MQWFLPKALGKLTKEYFIVFYIVFLYLIQQDKKFRFKLHFYRVKYASSCPHCYLCSGLPEVILSSLPITPHGGISDTRVVVTHCYMLMQVLYCMLCQIVELFCCSFLGKRIEELVLSVWVPEDKTVLISPLWSSCFIFSCSSRPHDLLTL